MNFKITKSTYFIFCVLVASSSGVSAGQLHNGDRVSTYGSWSRLSVDSEYVSDFGRRTLVFRSDLQQDSDRTVYLTFRLNKKNVHGVDIDSCNPYKFSYLDNSNLSASLKRSSKWIVDNTEVSMEEQCVKLSVDFSGDNFYYALVAKAASTIGNDFLIKEFSSNERDVTRFAIDDYKQSLTLSNTGFIQSLEELKSR